MNPAALRILDVLELRAAELDRMPQAAHAAGGLPLFGIPFSVKDNIDVAGLPTTAAYAAFAYRPGTTATVVQRLLDAGAIHVGKTNLDQFATGLVGVRSPYGVPANTFDAAYVPGRSSSGSAVAVAVAAGLVSFALGTDTAGSGRVPAAFNNIVGLKPTRGLVSNHGMVPACRSLDCLAGMGAVPAEFDYAPFAEAAALLHHGPWVAERYAAIRAFIEAFGAFVAEVPPPLAIDTVTLADSSAVKGFVCEPAALEAAPDISMFGGWRAYCESLSGATPR